MSAVRPGPDGRKADTAFPQPDSHIAETQHDLFDMGLRSFIPETLNEPTCDCTGGKHNIPFLFVIFNRLRKNGQSPYPLRDREWRQRFILKKGPAFGNFPER